MVPHMPWSGSSKSKEPSPQKIKNPLANRISSRLLLKLKFPTAFNERSLHSFRGKTATMGYNFRRFSITRYGRFPLYTDARPQEPPRSRPSLAAFGAYLFKNTDKRRTL